ncbi:ABC transporter ATP-binding protein [Cytobacillus praedii]|uniref:ABC transporter ATP-binding protein n=1 Tax=Cytobacillus praedii TaxID=1742358 RepID=UPI003F7E3C27
MKVSTFIWKLIMYRPWLFLINVSLWGIFHLTPIATGLIIKDFFDLLTGEALYFFSIKSIILFFMVFTIANILANILGGITHNTHDFSMQSLLRINLFNHILSKNHSNPHLSSTGETLNTMRDDADIAGGLIADIGVLPNAILFGIISSSILLSIDVKITLLLFLPIVALFILINVISKTLVKFHNDSRIATTEISGFLGELINVIQTIKINKAENNVIDKYKKLAENEKHFLLRNQMFSSIIDAVSSNTVQLATGLILFFAVGGSLAAGTLTVGEFSLFVFYIPFINNFMIIFVKILKEYKKTKASIGRLSAFVSGSSSKVLLKKFNLFKDDNDKYHSSATNLSPLDSFSVKDLSFHYPSHKGIHDINFNITKGSLTVIAGEVGSGKTTLIKCITGLLPIYNGRLEWNKKLITPDIQEYSNFAYTPQEPVLFTGSIKENILMGLPEDTTRIENSLYLAALKKDLRDMPLGIETPIGTRGVLLSGGQILRVAIARMFMRKADLYILDDPTSAVDIDTEKSIVSRMMFENNSTFLVVSNKKTFLEAADQIILLKEGKLIDKGTSDELLERSDYMQSLWLRHD